mmetsp:Transcript_52561/g.148960  ORF Transcript_52561/g.148960 Transcript_52561/m.148960 type:complete len:205 (-) Transcript_52561:573-1187(-)
MPVEHVSTKPRHWPCEQALIVWLPKRTLRKRTCQYPSPGLSTGDQTSGPAKRSALAPPSASSPVSSPKKRPKLGAKAASAPSATPSASLSNKLNDLPTERPLKPKPTMPSWGSDRKGRSVISVAATNPNVMQVCPGWPFSEVPPRQSSSLIKSPVACPSPTPKLLKPMEIASRCHTVSFPRPSGGLKGLPSAFTSLATFEASGA